MPFFSPQRVCSRAGTWATVRIKRHVVFTQRKNITQRRFYTQKPLHREGFTQSSFYTDAFAHRRFYIQKLLHRKALSPQKAFKQSSFTHRRFFTKKFLHTGTLTRRCPSFYTQELLHTHALQKEAFRHRNFYSLFTRKLLHRSFCTEMPLHTEAFTHRSFYTEKILHREAFSQTSVCGKELWAQAVFTYSSFHTEKPLRGPAFTLRFVFAEQRLCGAAFTHWSFDAERPLHRQGFYAQRFSHGSFTQRSFDTEKRLNRAPFIHRSIYTHKSFTYTQSFYTQTLLRIEACSQSLQTEGLTQRGLYTEQLLHTDAFTQRCTEQLLHTNAKRPQAFTHRSFYTQALHREASTQSIFQTQKHLHTKALHTHTQKLYTHTPVHTELLHTDAFTHRSLFTEQGLHRAAFTQREAFAQSSLYNLIHTETLNTQMPKLLHRQVFTHRGIYTQVLHTDAADASTYRSFWTQMPFHTEAFTQRGFDKGFDIYTPMHTEAFRHRWFFRESQKLWHREAFTQRIFYTQKLLHTQAFPQKLLHREAFEHELLHTDVFTNRRLVHTGLLRTEAFTQRSLYTQTLSHRKTDSTEQLLHTSKSRNFTFLTFGHHIVRRGCIRRWKIAILDVGQSFCVKWVAPDLVKSHFYTSFISRETVVPDDPKWIKSQFYTNFWTFASDVKKSSVFPQLLPFSFHATLASELSKYTSFWWLTLISCEGAAPGPAKFAFCHVFGCPTCAISVSADGCCGPKDKQDPHFATRLGIWHAAEGNVS